MSGTASDFNFAFPMIKRVFAQTITQDLVSVQPMSGGNTGDEINRIDREIKERNREGKIESIVTDKEYQEIKREDHPDYRKSDLPFYSLYMDFIYSGSTASSDRGV